MIFALAQLLGGISGVTYLISSTQKTHKRIMGYQIVDCTGFISSNFLLGGYAGALICCIALTRNILSYFDKLNKVMIVFLTLAAIVLTFLFIDMRLWLNWLPLINVIIYTIGVFFGNCRRTKYFMIFNTSVWCIYNLLILSYMSLLFNIVAIITTVTSLYKTKYED